MLRNYLASELVNWLVNMWLR